MTRLTTALLAVLLATTALYAEHKPAAVDEAKQGFIGIVLAQKEKQLFVAGLASGANAQKVGVKEGDEIVKIEGEEVHAAGEFVKRVKAIEPGKTAHLTVKRGDKELAFEILVVSRKEFLGADIEALKGKPVPAIAGFDARTGKKFDVTKLKGKPLVVELWATWCPACVASMPKLNEIARKHKKKLNVVALSYEEQAVVKQFAASNKKIVYDFVAADSSNLSTGFMNNTSIPKYIIVGADGVVEAVLQRVDEVGAYVAQLLKK